jgi:hypothetical protein
MTKCAPVLCLLALSSCFAPRGFRQERFVYNVNGHMHNMRLLVPRGFDRTRLERDSAGNTARFYYYRNDMVFYAAHLTDTAKQYQPIDYSRNLPLPHNRSGWIFKGMNPDERYWREIRVANYKFGYINVPRSREREFDEALNRASLQNLEGYR